MHEGVPKVGGGLMGGIDIVHIRQTRNCPCSAFRCVQRNVRGWGWLGSGAGVCPGIEVGSWVGLTMSMAEHGTACVQLSSVYNMMGSGVGLGSCATVCSRVEVGGMGGVDAVHNCRAQNCLCSALVGSRCVLCWCAVTLVGERLCLC